MSDKKLPAFLQTKVVVTALKVSLVVGSLLALINHGDKLLAWELEPGDGWRILLTYLVPYLVSSYSSWRMLERMSPENGGSDSLSRP